ncbi:DUF2059 domain-containing protein [Pseudaminobacter sp. 19-2017]|uniref:DUF2059 domain-containing protein n=1 Tax=Pseudaminobacter soli (ex Zhang et al. 2022) TaxID=2831468 RepID=A0A942I1T2_9HYPH|nr:DUF2059 domain-containing protein [Pseudaminobacter soli]MBS3647598.1 DUF2059 domain-containing protein [Pseudaminobacter soli]
MIRLKPIRHLAAAASAIVLLSLPAQAQEISAEHLKAARAAVSAIKATEAFDNILPEAAAILKQNLIQKNPDMQEVIIKTVDDKTIALAPRRADLEKEAALAYAKVFTAEELNAIASFYQSPAGQKLITDGPLVVRELGKAADIWQRGVARDLAAEVGKSLDEYFKAHQPQAPATAEGEPAKAN